MGKSNDIILDKKLLRLYLAQYARKKKRKVVLERRLNAFRDDIIGPKGMQISQVPRSKTNNKTDEPLDYCIRKEEIEEKIERQRKEAQSYMLKVIDAMDFLKQDSDERNILEYRYLDGMNWQEISEEYYLSRSTCIDHANDGLEQLLQFEKIRTVLMEFAEELTAEDREIGVCLNE